MKKIINRPDQMVYEMLDGLVAANPGKLKLIREKKIVLRADAPVKGKVAVLTGSGSGHEPDQVWYVGKGMMDAACAGEVFAAPTADAVYEATKMVDGGAGVLYLIKNYTGDRANFSMAAEMAQMEGIRVETVIANDDVAVKDSTWTAGPTGRGGGNPQLQDNRREGRTGRQPRSRQGNRRARECQLPQHGLCFDLVHDPGQRQPYLRSRGG